MKKPIFRVLAIFVTLSLLTHIMFVSPASGITRKEGYSTAIEYKVTDVNETTYQWYIPPDFSSFINYTIENGSVFRVDIEDITNQSSLIDLSIGNLTRDGIIDDNVQGALSLGYYTDPNAFGFISPKNWTEIDTHMENQSFVAYKYFNNVSYEFDGEEKDAVKFEFDDGFQQTHLTYDAEEGYLVEAHTVTGNFILGFELSAIDMTEQNLLNWYFLPILSGLMIALGVRLIRKQTK